MSGTRTAQLRHLGDFSTTRRVLVIAALAAPLGALSAGVAWALLHLIGLMTNLVFYQRLATRLVAPGSAHHSSALILAAPVLGGLAVGLIARFGSEKIRGHGIPEAIESILTAGSKVQPRVALLKPISSAIAIGTGGPFGAEGPIIMTGRRVRLDLRAVPAPDGRRAKDAARRGSGGWHGGDVQLSARLNAARGRAAAVRVASAQLHPGDGGRGRGEHRARPAARRP